MQKHSKPAEQERTDRQLEDALRQPLPVGPAPEPRKRHVMNRDAHRQSLWWD